MGKDSDRMGTPPPAVMIPTFDIAKNLQRVRGSIALMAAILEISSSVPAVKGIRGLLEKNHRFAKRVHQQVAQIASPLSRTAAFPRFKAGS